MMCNCASPPTNNMDDKQEKRNEDFLAGAKRVGKLTERDLLHGFYNEHFKQLINIKIMIKAYESLSPEEPGGKMQVGETLGANGQMQPIMKDVSNKKVLDANREQYNKQNLMVIAIQHLLDELPKE